MLPLTICTLTSSTTAIKYVHMSTYIRNSTKSSTFRRPNVVSAIAYFMIIRRALLMLPYRYNVPLLAFKTQSKIERKLWMLSEYPENVVIAHCAFEDWRWRSWNQMENLARNYRQHDGRILFHGISVRPTTQMHFVTWNVCAVGKSAGIRPSNVRPP